MRVLSIDLPWGGGGARAKYFGIATVDVSVAGATINLRAHRSSGASISSELESVRNMEGDFDLILVDQPIAGVRSTDSKYRSVERAFTNSAWARSDSGTFQCPRFQPGAAHAETGFQRARECVQLLGKEGCIALESFPQLSIPSLLEFARRADISSHALTGLKSHKGAKGGAAQDQLIAVFTAWTGRCIDTTTLEQAPGGRADAVDALLALLPILEWAGPTQGMEEPWSKPVWLNAFDPAEIQLPSECDPKFKKLQRAGWAGPLLPGKLGQPGVRTDGLVSMNLPGWLSPAAPARPL